MNAKRYSVFILLTLLVNLSIADASSIVWTNAASGYWGNPFNWNPNQVPGPSDTAVITNAGVTVTLNISPTVGGIILGTNGGGPVTLSLNNQTLSLNGPLTVNPSGSFTVDSGAVVGVTNAVLSGSIAWTAGSLGGTLTIATNSTVIVNGGVGALMDWNGTIVTNLGTFTWTSGHFRTGNGTTLYNYGLWNAQDDELYGADFGNGSTINNYGTFRKSGGASEFASYTTIGGGVLFNQRAGVIDVQNGTGTNGLQVSLQGGGNFTGGYVTTNQYGLTALATGSFNLNGTVTGTNTWQVNVASLVGNNVINGALTWVAGVWNNATVTIAPNSTVIVNGGAGNYMDCSGTIVTNLGTLTWASGHIRTGNGTTLYNYGTWNALDDELYGADLGSGSTINNFGTFRKTGGNWNGGSGTDTIIGGGVIFNQLAGVIDVQNGTNGLTLSLQGGGNLTGGYNTTNAAGFTYLSGGSFNVSGMLTAPNSVENSGNLVGANVVKGTLDWAGGNWDGAAVTIATNSTVIVNGGAANYMDWIGTIVTNLGTLTWASGHIRTGNGTTLYNYGTWNALDDELYGADLGSGSTINNFGTFRKTGGNWNGGSGTDTIIGGGVIFNQLAGVIDVQNGTNGLTLSLQGGGNLTGGYNTTNAAGFTYLSGGSFNVSGMLTAPNTVENAGNLTGANVVKGTLDWAGGNWDGAAVTIATNSTVIVNGGAANYMDWIGTIVTNLGTLTWASGHIRTGYGTTLYNYGTWNALDDELYGADFGNGSTINNYGTFRKSGGASEFASYTTIGGGVLFNQRAGVIDVQNGTNGLQVSLQGGGNFSGGYVTTNQYGLTALATGSFNVNGTVTGTNTWQVNVASLVGTNVINGALTWVAGVWNGATVTIAPNSTVIVNGGAGNYMDCSGSVVTNLGTLTWASGHIRTGNGTALYNYGTWNVQDDELYGADFANGSTINNYGTFRKTGGNWNGGSGTYTIIGGGVIFNQLAGVIDVQNGTNGLTLSLQGGGNLTGGYSTTNASGFTYLSSGSFNISGMLTAPNTVENSGNLVGANVVKGTLDWAGGNWDGAAVTIATNSTVVVNGGVGAFMDWGSTIVTNLGTLTWTSGHIRTGNGTTLYNYGLWNAQDDELYGADFGNGSTINNFGTFRKTATTGGSSAIGNGVNFVNTGTMDAQAGNIGLQGAYTLSSGGRLNFGLTSATNYGQISLSGAAALTGIVSANLNAGYIPPASTVFSVLSYGSATGLFSSSALPAGLTWTTNYLSASFQISVYSDLPSGSITNLASKLQSGSTLLTFTGAANASYTILASTNLFLPRLNWVQLGQASEPTPGNFQYLDSQTPGYPQRYYQIRSP